MNSYLSFRERQSTNFADEIRKKFEANSKPAKRDPAEEDETYWTSNHVRGEDGSGYAIFRFLPPSPNEEDPWVKYIEHMFQGAEHWYINRSRMSLGSNEKDPVYEYNGKIFKDKSLSESERKKRLLPRRVNYVANIYMIDDEKRPENNGKVFRYKFGQQVFNILQAAMFPEFKNIKPINPFDPFEGHNFVLRAITKRVGNNDLPSYEKSSFEPNPSSIVEDPKDFDAIWNSQYSLQEELHPSKYRPYAELKARFDLVMGHIDLEEYNEIISGDKGTAMERRSKPAEERPSREPEQFRPSVELDDQPVTKAKSFKEEVDDEIPFDVDDAPKKTTSFVEDDEDDDDDWFNNLKKG